MSPLIFVLSMIPLTQVLRKVRSGYTLKNEENLNYLLLMDDLKIFAKSNREVNGLILIEEILNNDTALEFGMKKCGLVALRRGK